MRLSTYCESTELPRQVSRTGDAEGAHVRVLLLSRYGNRGASSRLRTQQFLPYLRSHGFEVSVGVLLDDDYIDRIYSGRRPSIYKVALTYTQRVKRLIQSDRYDLLWVEREAFPWLFAAAELRLLTARGIPYVLELDDAIFHTYSDHHALPVRLLLGNKIERLMEKARLVIAGSEYIARHALSAGATWVEHVPTVVDVQRYGLVFPKQDRFTIGWIGTPRTVHFLQLVEKPLREFSRRHSDVQLLIVGAKRTPIDGIETVTVDWTEASEGQQVARMDVGIMPLTDGAFERGKCGYKLIQYMAASIPVMASPVGANRTIVQDGRNGFLAADDGEWIDKLEMLYRSPELRRSMGDAGRTLAEECFSLETTAPRLAQLLRCAANKRVSDEQL